MTIRQAIKHAKDVAENPNICEKCRNEHKKLAKWLLDLLEAVDVIEALVERGEQYGLDVKMNVAVDRANHFIQRVELEDLK